MTASARCSAVLLAVMIGCHADPVRVRSGAGVAQTSTSTLVGGREACAPCHEAIVREWEASPHRRSFSGAWFQSGYRIDHRSFCRDCHAPLHAGSDPLPGTVAYEDGITCVSCHAGARLHPSDEPHADFTTRACAACHQFRFPDEGIHARFDPSEQMQRTEDEWRASGTVKRCTDCHMAPGPSHRAHDFNVLGTPQRIADAIDLEGTISHRDESTHVEVRLSARDAGHAVPTGDVFRALELAVWVDGARPEKRLLMRRFGTRLAFDRGFVARLAEVEDSRVPARGVRTERFALEGRANVVHYSLDYLRVNPAQAAAQALDDRDNRMRLLEGVLTRPVD